MYRTNFNYWLVNFTKKGKYKVKTAKKLLLTVILILSIVDVKASIVNDYGIAQQEFDMNTDYSLKMVQAVCNGNYASGKEYERLRNLKKNHIGISDNLTYDDLLLLSKIVHAEAGSNWLTEEHRQLVASVVINRVNSPEFPNTISEVVYQRGQYSSVGTSYFKNLIPSPKATNSALKILVNGSIAPSSVVFQANFKQGSGVYKVINDSKLGSTYFCYSNNRSIYE